MQTPDSIAADMTAQQQTGNISRPTSASATHSPTSPRTEKQQLLQPTSTSTSTSRPATSSTPTTANPPTSHNLTPQQLAHYRTTFSLFDTHALGFIPTAHLGLALRSLHYNPTEQQLTQLLNTLDHDGSGLLSFAAFVGLVGRWGGGLGESGWEGEEELVGWWDVFDTYREGRLHVREVVGVLTGYGEPLSEADVEALVGEMAVDGDGMVDLRQFVRHMKETSSLDA